MRESESGGARESDSGETKEREDERGAQEKGRER